MSDSPEQPAPDLARSEASAGTVRSVRSFAAIVPRWLSLDSLGHILALVAVLGYIPGLLIVNMYLYKIGVSDFAILRTRFVLTGFLFSVPLLILAWLVLLAVATVWSFVDGVQRSGGSRRNLSHLAFQGLILLSIVAAIGGIGWAVARLVQHANVATRLDLISLIDPLAMGYLSFVFTILPFTLMNVLFFSYMQRFRNSESSFPTVARIGIVGATMATVILVGVLYLDFFTSTLYPIIPEQFGGGQPKAVTLVLAPDSSALGRELGFPQSAQGLPSRSVDLLWETENGYIVRDRSKSETQAIQIARDEVSAVVYEPGYPAVGTPVVSLVSGD